MEKGCKHCVPNKKGFRAPISVNRHQFNKELNVIVYRNILYIKRLGRGKHYYLVHDQHRDEFVAINDKRVNGNSKTIQTVRIKHCPKCGRELEKPIPFEAIEKGVFHA